MSVAGSVAGVVSVAGSVAGVVSVAGSVAGVVLVAGCGGIVAGRSVAGAGRSVFTCNFCTQCKGNGHNIHTYIIHVRTPYSCAPTCNSRVAHTQ